MAKMQSEVIKEEKERDEKIKKWKKIILEKRKK